MCFDLLCHKLFKNWSKNCQKFQNALKMAFSSQKYPKRLNYKKRNNYTFFHFFQGTLAKVRSLL